MLKTTVVVIGGGATGVGILRDLSMRGVDALLVERDDLGYWTSSRFHGLLHSGGRYAVKDKEAAKECIEENTILRKIGKQCVEATESIFVRAPEDSEEFEAEWVKSCKECGIYAVPMSMDEAFKLEPNLSRKLLSAYRCPGAAVDGFRLLWQTVASANKYGGKAKTYTEVIGIETVNGEVAGVHVRDRWTGEEYKIACDYVISATGSFAGNVAHLAGIDVNVKPSKGTLIAFNHRICNHVVHRLHPSSDADIFVPHGSITILGTSSIDSAPDDTSSETSEVLDMMNIGKVTFENLYDYRILRVFAGTRPLYSADPNAKGRSASRGFVALDHAHDGIKHFMSVCGGKFTTYRLMAEKVCDIVCEQLGVNTACRTAEENLVDGPSDDLMNRAKAVFPSYGAELAASRLGNEKLERVIKRIESRPETKELVCECENVTLAEIEEIASEPSSHTVSDLRRRTRLGMGTCQGTFCAYRSVGAVDKDDMPWAKDTVFLFKEFLETRWKGIRPVLWGNMLRDIELTRAIYDAALNLSGVDEIK
ncbi:anaerobic glycerol-3-phosphate dehydrogenase subunit GlpA [Pectinatus brassicae]|uniref:glycerol-3-phosphate dehydrogenase n=1 Tax=Pectinatus brassicae TaxID=862415 RepID=A0A840UIK8_9FIRM|nr:anaerobic glycerol-3-phosphate dehydrogenase subunit GlpA [Pectinatus brassicae]MBB5335417.1 glycerol-3-phosphate dehydrogenase [Pectinatus brassicae]